jgi:hypothetical protein
VGGRASAAAKDLQMRESSVFQDALLEQTWPWMVHQKMMGIGTTEVRGAQQKRDNHNDSDY